MLKALPRIGIVILHYGDRALTLRCLDYLDCQEHQGFVEEIVIVNNEMNKELTKAVKEHPLRPTVLVPERNLGFAQGNNWAVEYGTRQGWTHIWFLNNDTQVENGCLAQLIKTSQAYQNEVVLSPVIQHPKNPQGCYAPIPPESGPGQALEKGDKKPFSAQNLIIYDYGGYIRWGFGQTRHIHFETKQEVYGLFQRDFVSGCALFVPMIIWKQIGPFREDYFLYLEDVEWCLRAKKQKVMIAVDARAEIFHWGSQSITPIKKLLYSWRNNLKLVWEYWPRKKKITAIFTTFLFYSFIIFKFQVNGFTRRIANSRESDIRS